MNTTPFLVLNDRTKAICTLEKIPLRTASGDLIPFMPDVDAEEFEAEEKVTHITITQNGICKDQEGPLQIVVLPIAAIRQMLEHAENIETKTIINKSEL